MFYITSAVSILGAYKPCPSEARRFRLTLFCSLLKVYLFRTCRGPYCTKIRHCTPLRPQQHKVDWMNGSRHNKNANRQTDTEIPDFIREKNMFSPSLRSSEYSVLITSEASKLKNYIRTSPSLNGACRCDRVWDRETIEDIVTLDFFQYLTKLDINLSLSLSRTHAHTHTLFRQN